MFLGGLPAGLTSRFVLPALGLSESDATYVDDIRHALAAVDEGGTAVIFNGVPPYNLWEHPPSVGRLPPHRTDAGSYLLAECFGCKSVTLVKDVDGLYEADPNQHPDAEFIDRIHIKRLRERGLTTLPFDRILIDLLENARLVKEFQVVNGQHPERIAAAVRGEHVGTIVYSD